MSTDITLEVEREPHAADFDEYVRDSLDAVARAVALAINDPATTSDALTVGLTAARRGWDNETMTQDPDRVILGTAIRHVIDQRAQADVTDPATLPPLIGPACTVTYFGLNWPLDKISATLQLSPEAVQHHLEQARSNGIAHHTEAVDPSTFDIRYQVRQLLAQQEPPALNVRRIERRYRWGSRRKTLKIAGIATVGLLVALVLLAQLVERPDRVADDEGSPAITVAALQDDQTNAARAAAGEIGTEPRPDLVPTPQLIATDGVGGFVGVLSPSAQNSQVTFTRSTDGESWSLASRWNLGGDASIERFERSGDYYMAWIGGVAASSEDVIGTVGISRDLIAWTVVELALDDQAPYALIFERKITDLSVSGDNILALVTTNVEIDFGALSLSEGYTCGRTITEDEVTVNLCNAELDVLSFSDVAVMPERTRLFVSRSGRPFEQIAVPFGTQTAAHLTTVNGAFAVTDETGIRFATSRDAVSWQTVTAGKPAFPVRSAATNTRDELVGLGELPDGRSALFHNDGQAANTTTIALDDLLGSVSPDVQAVVASGSSRWVVYLYEPQVRAWLLTSRTGLDWTVTETPPPAAPPRLLVGDDEALLQWNAPEGGTITMGIPLR